MEKLWTSAEVAKYLGIAEPEVEQLVQEGRLTGYKLGGEFLRFRPEQVEELKATMKPQPQGQISSTLEPKPWHGRLSDFLYFYDFYLVSFALLAGLVVYLLSSG